MKLFWIHCQGFLVIAENFHSYLLTFFVDANADIKEALLKAKLEQCCIMCQFESTPQDGASAYTSTDALSDASAMSSGHEPIFISPAELRNREIKRTALMELIEHISQINSASRALPDSLYPHFFAMVRCICARKDRFIYLDYRLLETFLDPFLRPSIQLVKLSTRPKMSQS